jgi:hypothetical protein
LALCVDIIKGEWVRGTPSNLPDGTSGSDLRGDRELWISEEADLATLIRDLHNAPRE